MIDAWVTAIGCAAPGMPGWRDARRILRGEAVYTATPLPHYRPRLLPPNERRRAPPAVCQAFQAAEDAFADARTDPSNCATVFASSDGDTSITQRMSMVLASPARSVSPTDFHNSVHNAAAGYWSIAVGSHLPSTALGSYDTSFASGLLEAAVLACVDGFTTLLVAYDVPVPEPLHAQRPISSAVSVALLLSTHRNQHAAVHLQIKCGARSDATVLQNDALEALRQDNPAARALPLLNAIAREQNTTVLLDTAGNDSLCVTVGAP